MRRLLLGIMVLLFAVIGLTAQDDDTGDISGQMIYIDVGIDLFEDDADNTNSVPAPEDTYYTGISDLIVGAGQQVTFLGNPGNGNPEFFVNVYDPDEIFYPTTPTIALRINTTEDGLWINTGPYDSFEQVGLPRGNYNLPGIFVDDEASLDLSQQIIAGIALYAAEDCTDALPLLDDALANAEDGQFTTELAGPALQFYRGSCLYLQGDLDGATDAYTLGMESDNFTDPELTDDDLLSLTDPFVTNLAQVYIGQGDFENAIALLDTHNEFSPELLNIARARLYTTRARLYLAAGDRSAATDELGRLSDNLPEDNGDRPNFFLAEIHLELAQVWFEVGGFLTDFAIVEIAVADSLAPEHPLVKYWRGVVSRNEDAPDEAEAYFREFISLHQDFNYNYAHLPQLPHYLEDAWTFIYSTDAVSLAPVVNIYVEVNEPANPGVDFAVGRSVTTPDIHGRVLQQLIDVDYQPNMIARENRNYSGLFEQDFDNEFIFAPDTPIISMRIQTFGEDDALYITPYAAFEFRSLPYGSQGVATVVVLDDDAALEVGVQLTAGMALYTDRACLEALSLFDAAYETISADPEAFSTVLLAPTVQFYRGNCLYQLGDIDGAIDAYTTALTHPDIDTQPGPDDVVDPRSYGDFTRINLAYIYVEQGDNAAAIDTLNVTQGMLTTYSSTETVYRFATRADLYIAAGDVDAGLAEMDELISLLATGEGLLVEELFAQAYTQRGRILGDLGEDVDAAFADFATAIEINPDYPFAYYWRGLLHRQNGDNAAAQEDLTTFIELSADYDNYYEQNIVTFVTRARALLDE